MSQILRQYVYSFIVQHILQGPSWNNKRETIALGASVYKQVQIITGKSHLRTMLSVVMLVPKYIMGSVRKNYGETQYQAIREKQ